MDFEQRSVWPDVRLTAETLERFQRLSLETLMAEACRSRDVGHGRIVSVSPKVFIPLTRLCRDVCGYCTFAHSPRPGQPAFMSIDDMLAVARAGVEAGCSEALFTLGEMPEQRYAVARQELEALGCATTIDYLVRSCEIILSETGLLPHVNPGIMTAGEMQALRKVAASQGIMLESTSARLLEKGGPHHGSKGKIPQVRIDTILEAGRLAIPFTTGILIGIGESREDRIESLLVIKAMHERYGHIQEVIVQNFQPKPGTRMAETPGAGFDELLWTASVARLVLGPAMNIQVPPNLSYDRFPELLAAGINDWGGVSPVTPDHVNPEANWPALDILRSATERAGLSLVPRLPVYPRYARDQKKWIDDALTTPLLRASDTEGWARSDSWAPGAAKPPQLPRPSALTQVDSKVERLLASAEGGTRLDAADITRLFAVRDGDFDAVIGAADRLRARVNGERVSYVVNRNINYTNICGYHCSFCAFAKGKNADHLRGKPYELDLEEVSRRVAEAWDRGATEVCMQGGIHPRFTGHSYLDFIAAAKRGASAIHIHAFSPLEVTHGASTLGVSVERYLRMLRDAGLGSLPGTAAEILDDEARQILCPDKLTSAQWLHVVGAAHEAGLRTTSTIMFGHVDHHAQWARHLLSLRDLQERTLGFTEFVPLPFVHMEAPLYFRGHARKGPTFREAVLMHAVARLVLHPLITNIQASWVKLGVEGIKACLAAGVNDLGGTLMNESISRAAGTEHGQEFPPGNMDAVIHAMGRAPRQRTALYANAPVDRVRQSYAAAPLQCISTSMQRRSPPRAQPFAARLTEDMHNG